MIVAEVVVYGGVIVDCIVLKYSSLLMWVDGFKKN